MIGPVNLIDRALAEVAFVSIFRDGYHEIAFGCHCVRTPNFADWCQVHERLPEPLRRLTLGLGLQLEAPGGGH